MRGKNQSFWQRLAEIKLHHIAFWLLLYVALVWLNDANQQTLARVALTELINVSFYMIIVYFNLLYLVPQYLTEKKFPLYGILLVISAAAITPIKMMCYVWLLDFDIAARRFLIANQFYIFLTHFVAAGTSTITKIIFEWMRHQRERTHLQTQSMQTELRFLKSQINPHFLFNTLNNLYALTLKKSDRAPEVVLKLSEIMRYILYECNEKRVPLSREIKYLRNYIDLEELRQGHQFDIQFEVIGDVENRKIAPLIFIPFLENCFKHGVNYQANSGFVHIHIRVEGSTLIFDSVNSKIADTEKAEKIIGGIGLTNVKRRLQLIYPQQHELRIEDLASSYRVHLRINLTQ